MENILRESIFQGDLFLYNCLQSFNFAKKASSGDDKHGPEYLELREFRLFMQTLVQHLAYLRAFSKYDFNALIILDMFICPKISQVENNALFVQGGPSGRGQAFVAIAIRFVL